MKPNPEEVIKEALTVRDDGQEPKFEVHDYECALLDVARGERSPTEDFPTALARSVETSDYADALIFAADRARARASFGKSAPRVERVASPSGLDAILADAERVSKGAPPRFTRDQAETAMLDLAKREASAGETPSAAFARLCEGDVRMRALYALGEAADIAEVQAATKAAPQDDRFYPMLLDLASMRKRAGETIETACARLLTEDPVVRDAYAASQGL